MFREQGAGYFNPDEAARRILLANPGMTHEQANSAAWHQGKRLLERAISERLDFRSRPLSEDIHYGSARIGSFRIPVWPRNQNGCST
jgi:hypothetical protein